MTRRRATVLLAVSLVVLLGGSLAANAAAPGPVPAQAAPDPPLPLPTDAPCAPGSTLPVCQAPAPGTTPPPTGVLLPPTTLPAPPACEPGLPLCSPGGAPCRGPGCIPHPGTPEPTTTPPSGQPGDSGDADCGWSPSSWGGCITNAINGFFRDLVMLALNPLLDLLSHTLLTTPSPDALPGLGALWANSWQILLACYALLVVVAGGVLMAYQTLQARYSVKEIAPRLVVGFLAGALSLWVATRAVELANALAQAVVGDGLDVGSAGETLKTVILNPINLASGNQFATWLALALAVVLVVLLVTYIVRVALTVILIAGAPIALMCHALPQTEGIAYWWWKAFGGCLAVQVVQSLALVTALKVFLAPGGFTLFGPNVNGVVNILVALALMYILFKIPFWLLSSAKGGRGGRSLLGSLVRGFIAYKTFGLLKGPRHHGGAAPRRAATPPPDPPMTSTGQYMLPLGVKRVAKPFRTSQRGWHTAGAPATTSRRPGPGQLSLFTPTGRGTNRAVRVNPRALPPASLPHALPTDQLGLPFTLHRDPDHRIRRSLADDLAGRPAPPPVGQPGLLTPDGRINRRARPTARQPNALISPAPGMLPIHLRPAPPHPARRSLADDLADPSRVVPRRAPQTGPGLIHPSGAVNPAARTPAPRDAYTGNRPLPSGQYPLPLDVKRQPKPAPPKPPARTPRTRAGTQLRLPLDLPKPPRPTPPPKPTTGGTP